MGFRCDIQQWGVRLALVSRAGRLGGCKRWILWLGTSPRPCRRRQPVAAGDPVDLSYVPPNDPLRRGLYHFHRGEFGLAEQLFPRRRRTSPDNVTAWIGLAGAYDNLRRFDLADRAYARPSGSPARRRKSSTTRATPTCCAAISWRARALRKAPKRDPHDGPSGQSSHRERPAAPAGALNGTETTGWNE